MEQATLGLLVLDTSFPRPHGDVGNSATWDFPVILREVGGASARKVILEDPRVLFEDFVMVGRSLIADGCTGLATSCGFLSLMQSDLKEALGVPFASSPLMQLPWIEALLPRGQLAGVLTISENSLSGAHLRAVGARPDTDIRGLPQNGSFATAIFEDSSEMDFDSCGREMVDAGMNLISAKPSIGAIVLECTNMAPYAAEVSKSTGRPVYSIVSFLNWFQSGLTPPGF